MNAEQIISIIKRRRDEHRESQASGSAADPDGGVGAQQVWAIATEYDSLLAEIEDGIVP